MRLVLTGANGQVAREVARQGPPRGHEVAGLTHADLDIADGAAVDRTLDRLRPEAVINAAAYTAVDRAEEDEATAFAVNRDGAGNLAAGCARLGVPLLHISTDYIFDGRKQGPYREDDPAAPLGAYGRSKWEGECAVRAALERHLILRVSWVFGVDGNNFVKTMLRLAREREELRVVGDQHGCPTYAGDIAATLLSIAEQADAGAERWGTYHYCGTPATTWHAFAEAIIARARELEPLKVAAVRAITTAEFPTPAPRPANSVLDCGRIGEAFGIQPAPWSRGLETLLSAVYAKAPG